MDQQQMLERANYASHGGGAAPARFAGAKICSGPIVGKKVAKSWWCWCGLGRKVAQQSVQLVRSTSSTRQWCGSQAELGGMQ